MFQQICLQNYIIILLCNIQMAKNAVLVALLILLFGGVTYINYEASKEAISDANLNQLDCGFGKDFQKFLSSSDKYKSYNFERTDLKCGAYGGKQSKKDEIKKTPIIFIHGNSDVAFGRGTTDGYVSWQTGFRSLANYLTNQGYQKSELYTTTWGPADPNQASQNWHKKEWVMRMRVFLEAVIEYTGAPKVVVIGHSMGVSIGRGIVKGGSNIDHVAGTYDIGPSLSSKVSVFIGLAGANLGLTGCFGGGVIPTCSNVDGFNPGSLPSSGPSKFLSELNNKGGTQGGKVYTIWSKYDDLILYECVVWGKVTCRIPGQNDEVIKTTSEWGHFAVRDNTGPDIIKWLQ